MTGRQTLTAKRLILVSIGAGAGSFGGIKPGKGRMGCDLEALAEVKAQRRLIGLDAI